MGRGDDFLLSILPELLCFCFCQDLRPVKFERIEEKKKRRKKRTEEGKERANSYSKGQRETTRNISCQKLKYWETTF